MANDWIKMRANLRTHPKVVRISSALKADRLRVIGALHAVWCLFDEHSVDGRLLGYTPGAIDEDLAFPGLADAMMGIGWLCSDGNDGLSLPEFDAHNSASAKRRSQESDRKKAARSTANSTPNERPQSVRNLSAKASASDADKKRTREEKRREENKNPPKAPKGAIEVPTWIPEKPWAEFVAMRRAKGSKIPFTSAAARGIIEKLDGLRGLGYEVGAILNESVINGWSGVFEPKAARARESQSALAGAL